MKKTTECKSKIIVGISGKKGHSVVNYSDLYDKLTVEKVRSKLRVETFIRNFPAILNTYEALFMNEYPDWHIVEEDPNGAWGIGIPLDKSEKQCELVNSLRNRYVYQLMITECADRSNMTEHSWRYHHAKYIKEFKDWLINNVYDNQLALAIMDNGHLFSDKKLQHMFLSTILGYINTYKFMSRRYDHGNFNSVYNFARGIDLRGYNIGPRSTINTALNAIYERFVKEIRDGIDMNGNLSTDILADIYRSAPSISLADILVSEIYR